MQVRIGGKVVSMQNAECIGEGNFAKVYKVYSEQDKCYLAVRYVEKSPEEMEDLVKEKNINKQLMKVDSPHILRIIEIQENDKYVLYVTEFCEGGSLWECLNEQPGNKLGDQCCIELALRIARGIQVIHNHKITHRDLKPQNILMSRKYVKKQQVPDIKIADFGLSTKKMIMNTFAGTKEYIAPEQARYQSYTNAVDVWALGIIIDQMLHGSTFFSGDNNDIFKKIVSQNYYVRDKTIIQPIQQLLVSMLKKKPFERPTIGQIISQLQNILQKLTTPAIVVVAANPVKSLESKNPSAQKQGKNHQERIEPAESFQFKGGNQICISHNQPITHVFQSDLLCPQCLAEDTLDVQQYLGSESYLNSLLLRVNSPESGLVLKTNLSQQDIKDSKDRLRQKFEEIKKSFCGIMEGQVSLREYSQEVGRTKASEKQLEDRYRQVQQQLGQKVWGLLEPQIISFLDQSVV